MFNRTAQADRQDGPYFSQAHGCYVESEWQRTAARRAVDRLYSRYERPKPARTSRRAMIVIAVLALCVLALIAVDLAGVL